MIFRKITFKKKTNTFITYNYKIINMFELKIR